MNRAMFSGVAGLKSHQTKMDVIGNNIANVNTYGYKSQRAVFSDIYYQTLTGASAGTANRGGINPSSVGYGSTLSGIQTQMSASSLQNTGFGMDVAIMGDGFLQVMDSSGNIFYTKAGLLDYDANGYLTDINGNFVLGAPGATGKPGSQKIRLDNIGSVDPKVPSTTVPINGTNYTLTASNATKYGNIAISLGASDALPAGLKAKADISSNGSISVVLNSFEKFGSMADVNAAINAAISEANHGQPHAAGTFTLTADHNKFGTDPTDGTWMGSAMGDPSKVTSTLPTGFFGGGLSLKSLNLASFPGADETSNMQITTQVVGGVTSYRLTATVNGVDYTGTFPANVAEGATIAMTAPGGTGSITMEVSSLAKLKTVLGTIPADGAHAESQMKTTAPKYFFGGSAITKVSPDFNSNGPMTVTYAANGANYEISIAVGGKVYKGTVNQATGGNVELKTGDTADGSITMTVPKKTDMLKNYGISPTDVDAATKLTNQLNSSLGLHQYVGIPATSGVNTPLTGAEICGVNFGILPGKIAGFTDVFGGAMTFIGTSTSFTGKGNVSDAQFQSTYHENAGAPFWTVDMEIGGVKYSANISKDTLSSSLLLKGPKGDSIEVSNPGFDAMNNYFKTLNPGVNPADGSVVSALKGGTSLNVTPSTPSKALGLSQSPFALSGGTEGGAITLDQLASISIGLDGTVSVSHAEKGTVVAGKLSLANFANPSGLLLEGKSYFSATANSGTAKLCDPGSGGTGGLKSSALEMSNVDLSSEFADMITTQRGFQANSRIITVSDSMLEELINLKR